MIRIEIDLGLIRGTRYEAGNIIIPASENAIYFRKRKDSDQVRMLASFYCNSRKEIGQYGETHIIKQALNAKEKELVALGQKIDLPIIGNIVDTDANKTF